MRTKCLFENLFFLQAYNAILKFRWVGHHITMRGSTISAFKLALPSWALVFSVYQPFESQRGYHAYQHQAFVYGGFLYWSEILVALRNILKLDFRGISTGCYFICFHCFFLLDSWVFRNVSIMMRCGYIKRLRSIWHLGKKRGGEISGKEKGLALSWLERILVMGEDESSPATAKRALIILKKLWYKPLLVC